MSGRFGSGGTMSWNQGSAMLRRGLGLRHATEVLLALEEDQISIVTGNWVQEQLGGLYLSSDWARNMDLAQINANQTLLVATNDPRAALLKYDPSNQRIAGAFSMCLTRNNSNLVQFLPCSTGDNQKWAITIDRQIRNVQNNQCLTVSEINEASLQPCSFATLDISLRQHWAFHPQP